MTGLNMLIEFIEFINMKFNLIFRLKLSDARKNLELSVVHPLLRPAAGLYPTILDQNQADAMLAFTRRERSKLFAIGEVGLDF